MRVEEVETESMPETEPGHSPTDSLKVVKSSFEGKVQKPVSHFSTNYFMGNEAMPPATRLPPGARLRDRQNAIVLFCQVSQDT